MKKLTCILMCVLMVLTVVPAGISAADNVLTIPEATALAKSQGYNAFTSEKYYVTGEVSSIASTTYGNLYIKDSAGNTLYIYGTYSADGSTRYDKMTKKPQVGDVVTLYGVLGMYKNTTPEMKAGWVVSHLSGSVSHISLASAPFRSVYLPGTQELDLTGGKINVHYTDGTSEQLDITADMVSGYDLWKRGAQTVTVTCGGYTCSFSVTVAENFVSGWSIALGDYIGLDFKVELSETVRNDPAAYISLQTENRNVTVPVNGQSPQIVHFDLSAAEMSQLVDLEIIDGDGLTLWYEGCTVREYAQSILDSNSGPKLKKLLNAMLSYGGASQRYYNYDVENAADQGIQYEFTEPSQTAQPMALTDTLDGVDFYGVSLLAQDRTVIRYYFKTDRISDLTFTCGGTVCTPMQKDGLYYVDAVGIAPNRYDEQVVVEVTDGEGVCSVSYSVLNYIERVYADADAAQQEWITALYNYHLAAEEYLATPECAHQDRDDDGTCDVCDETVIVIIDFYAINDLHGKFVDTDDQPGVDELSTYLKNARQTDDHVVLLSSGDMWQGSAESNLTFGNIMTEWMNEMDFVSMTIGNHEFDWGEEKIVANRALAEFPFLAINIYDSTTNAREEYCQSSVMVECGDLQIGIIGAVGDVYSSISGEQTDGFYFKTGTELTALVKAESQKLRDAGADFIVFSVHDDMDNYDEALSDGYVDLVFEGHTHTSYTKTDSYGVYHIQGGGENSGISHAEATINTVTGSCTVTGENIKSTVYSAAAEDPIVDELMEKYDALVGHAYETLGYNRTARSSSALQTICAQLYCEKGLELWGDEYNIVLGGGKLNVRSPYTLDAGNVTYADLLSLFPFDNQFVLCSIKGSHLKSRFINNSNYDVYLSPYGQQIKNSISDSATYYIVVDSYNSSYAYNQLTEVARLDEYYFARDLLADYIRAGGME